MIIIVSFVRETSVGQVIKVLMWGLYSLPSQPLIIDRPHVVFRSRRDIILRRYSLSVIELF